MQPPEIIKTDQTTIACDGNGQDPGHPRVFLNMGDKAQVDCPYCGRRFILEKAA